MTSTLKRNLFILLLLLILCLSVACNIYLLSVDAQKKNTKDEIDTYINQQIQKTIDMAAHNEIPDIPYFIAGLCDCELFLQSNHLDKAIEKANELICSESVWHVFCRAKANELKGNYNEAISDYKFLESITKNKDSLDDISSKIEQLSDLMKNYNAPIDIPSCACPTDVLSSKNEEENN